MVEIIESAKQDFERARDRMIALLNETPEERLNWSPSSTARTPLALLAHSAMSIHHITEMLKGRPFAGPSTAVADRGFRDAELEFTGRNSALALFEGNAAAYLLWLEGIGEHDLGNPITLPFGLGTATIRDGLFAAVRHTESHIAQLEYLQTIYGDRDWHIGA